MKNKFDMEFKGGKGVVRVNYDSAKGVWQDMELPWRKFSNVYGAIASQVQVTELLVRESVADYLKTNPAVAKELYSIYKKPIIEHKAVNDNKPKAKSTEGPSKSSGNTQTGKIIFNNGEYTPIEVQGPPLSTDQLKDLIAKAKGEYLENKAMTVDERLAGQEAMKAMDKAIAAVEKGDSKTGLKIVAENLENFVEKYPWAGTAFSTMSIALKTIAYGPAGLVAGVVGEVQGRVVGAIAAPAVNEIILKSAHKIQSYDPSLTEKQAVILAGSALAALGIGLDAKSMLNGMKSIIGRIDLGCVKISLTNPY